MEETLTNVPLNTLRLGEGRGEPLIVLHGWGHSLAVLQPLGELLSAVAEVHLIDLPGFGDSAEPRDIWGTDDYAKRILAYLDEQGLSRVTLLGHSFGGKVSLRIAADHPERVQRLVLLSSSGLKPRRPWKKKLRMFMIAALRNLLRSGDRRFGWKLYEQWFIPRFASADYKTAGVLRKTFVRIVNEDLSGIVEKIKAPTLILWGEQDTETPLEMAHRLHRLIPQSKLVTLPGKGHQLFLDAGAHLCAFHIKPFLNAAEAQREEEATSNA